VSRLPTFTFQLSIMSKWLAKHLSTKVPFKSTVRKRHVYIDFGWPLIWNQYFYLGIWKDDRTKIIVLRSFLLVTRINSQNSNDIEFINVLWHFILYMNIGNSNWHNWSFHFTNIKFLHYFSSLDEFWQTCTWKSLVHTSWAEMERCERVFLLLKMGKKKISWNIRTKCITDLLLTVTSSRMKDYTCQYEVST